MIPSSPILEEMRYQARLEAEEKGKNYVRCCVCREKLYAADDWHSGDEAYCIDGFWYCDDCIRTLRQEVVLA